MYRVLGCMLICAVVLFGVVSLTFTQGAEGTGPQGTGGSTWEFRNCSTAAQGYVLMRFKPATGEAWSRYGAAWRVAEDTAELPAGPYDVAVLPSKEDRFYAFRYNLRTGQAWYLSEGNWVAFAEPQQ
jgi:hypothetical protein